MTGSGALAPLLAALSHRNYRLFWYGNIASHPGTWAQRLAIGWLTWELTESGFWLGVIAAADLAPTVFLAPLTGALADRFDRLKVMRIAQSLNLLQALTLAALTIFGLITIELLFILTLIGGAIVAANQPARLAIVPSLVPRRDMTAAIGINSLTFNAGRIIGPAIAGLLIEFANLGFAFLFNGITFGIFLITLFLIRIDHDETASRPRRSVRELPGEIADGYRYAVGHVGIGPLLVILTALAICARPYVDLLPGFADDVFGRGAQALAWLTSMTGLGAMVGGWWIAKRGGVNGLTGMTINGAAVMALALIGFAATDYFVFACICVMAAGFGMIVVGVGEQTLIQNAVDPAMRGRVMSLYGMIGRGAPAIGALLMGTASTWIGLQWPVVIGAVAVLGIWVWARRRKSTMAAALEVQPD